MATDTSGALIRLTGVTKTFGGIGGSPAVSALGPINLDIRTGEFFSVVGPSGCGKSTLLEILAGLSEPSEGSVTIRDKKVTGVSDGVGVVFQEDASFAWLNVYDNIAFGLRRRGVEHSIAEGRIERALELTGLKDFAKAYPAQLSGGMRQRVCIARTLVLEPQIILLDEPFGALDQQTRLLMGDEVLDLWRATGATIVLITHSLDEAAMLSDRVGVMSARPGRFLEIIETGWPRDRDSTIVSEPEFGAIAARLWSLLRVESLKSNGSTNRIRAA